MARNIAAMSPKARKDYFEELFMHDISIEQIALPEACTQYPDYRDEIQAAYLKYTTFVFKVWINYDAAASKFYTDHRADDCGKLIFTPKVTNYLHAVKAHEVLLQNIRLDIGSPFRTFARLTIEVRPSKLNVGPQIDLFFADGTHGQHPILAKYIGEGVYAKIQETDVTNGKDGFNIADLEELADKWFQPKPSQGKNMHHHSRSYDGPWVGAYDADG